MWNLIKRTKSNSQKRGGVRGRNWTKVVKKFKFPVIR